MGPFWKTRESYSTKSFREAALILTVTVTVKVTVTVTNTIIVTVTVTVKVTATVTNTIIVTVTVTVKVTVTVTNTIIVTVTINGKDVTDKKNILYNCQTEEVGKGREGVKAILAVSFFFQEGFLNPIRHMKRRTLVLSQY